MPALTAAPFARGYFRSVELTAGGPVLVPRDAARLLSARPAVVVAPLVAGICSSDRKEVHGNRQGRRDFGHEWVARVLHSDAPELQPGQLVYLDPHVAVQRGSGFAERIALVADHDALVRALRPLPPQIGVRQGTFIEPLACAVHCVGRLRRAMDAAAAGPRGTIGIVGAGTAGILIAALLKLDGVTVRLYNRAPARLAWLRARALFTDDELRPIDAAGDRDGAVVVATAFADGGPLQLAYQRVAAGGAIVLFAGTSAGTVLPGTTVAVDRIRREELLRRVDWCGTDVLLAGTHGATTEDFATAERALAHSAEMRGMVDELVTRTIALHGVPRALADGEPAIGKCLVTFA